MALRKPAIRFLADGGTTPQPNQIPNAGAPPSAYTPGSTDMDDAANPGLLGGMGYSLFGGGPNAAQKLESSGYTPYQETAGPDVSGDFQGYQAISSNEAGGQPYADAQSALLKQLGAQATGTGGPTVADQQLQRGMGSSIAASKAAAAGARGSNAGLVAPGLATTLANTTAGGAGDAAALRASEQTQAQAGLQGAVNAGESVAENNQGAQNQAALYAANAKESYGNLLNQNWQYGNNLNAQQQAQYNAMIGSMEGAGSAGQMTGSAGAGMGALGSLASGASSLEGVAADGMVAMDDGGVMDSSQADNFPTGGGSSGGSGGSGGGGGDVLSALGTAAGIASMFLGEGQVDIPSQARNFPKDVATPRFESKSWYDPKSGGKVPSFPGSATSGQNSSLGATGPSSQALSPGQLQNPGINPEAGSLLLTDPSQGLGGGIGGAGNGAAMGDSASAGLGGTLHMADGGAVGMQPHYSQYNLTGPGGGASGGTGYDPTARMGGQPMADGGVSAPVAHGPEKAIIGENGPEAVVPIKPNGDVDQARARNPAVQQLLASHPDLRHIDDAGAPPGQPTGTGDHATAAALAMAGAHLSDRVANLERLLSSQARKNQRRAA
jgi:hypothetical protein